MLHFEFSWSHLASFLFKSFWVSCKRTDSGTSNPAGCIVHFADWHSYAELCWPLLMGETLSSMCESCFLPSCQDCCSLNGIQCWIIFTPTPFQSVDHIGSDTPYIALLTSRLYYLNPDSSLMHTILLQGCMLRLCSVNWIVAGIYISFAAPLICCSQCIFQESTIDFTQDQHVCWLHTSILNLEVHHQSQMSVSIVDIRLASPAISLIHHCLFVEWGACIELRQW